MFYHFLKKRNTAIFFFILFILIPLYTILAETMESDSFRIMSDTINVGGESSSSDNYILNDTLGEIATGYSNSGDYYMHAGFWQMQESYISISPPPADLTLTAIGGINGEGSEGTISWTVTTDNWAGYSMSIKANTTPALTSAEDSFANYVLSGADPDYNFSIASNTSAFGFSPEGTDTVTRFRNTGTVCNSGTGETASKCWDGLSATPQTVFNKNTSNHPSGSTDVVRFRAESGANHIQISGSYTAPITVTAVTL
jgi:hypothetical protein